MPVPTATPTMDTDLLTREHEDTDHPWITLVLDDPVTPFNYVIGVLQKLFDFDRATAEKLTFQVHNDGKAAVFSGTLEEAEAACLKVLAAGLRSRYEQGGGS